MDLAISLLGIPVAEAKTLDEFIVSVNSQIINPIILFLFALALMFFLYGMLQFFLNPESEESKSTGKQHMLWGIIGLVIMMGVFTILNILMSTLGIEGINVEEGTVDLPEYNP